MFAVIYSNVIECLKITLKDPSKNKLFDITAIQEKEIVFALNKQVIHSFTTTVINFIPPEHHPLFYLKAGERRCLYVAEWVHHMAAKQGGKYSSWTSGTQKKKIHEVSSFLECCRVICFNTMNHFFISVLQKAKVSCFSKKCINYYKTY